MIYRFGQWELDSDRFELRDAGCPVAIERKTFDVALCLLANRPRVVSRQELLAAVWPGVSVGQRVIDQAVYSARRILRDDPRSPSLIETVRGRGHRWVADAVEVNTAFASPSARGPAEVPLVGRSSELEVFDRALDRLEGDRGTALILRGPPGVGKSRLLDEFRKRASARFLCLAARCSEVAGAPPLWPWIQLLRQLRDKTPEDRWRAEASIFPELGRIDPALDPSGGWRGRQLTDELGSAPFQLVDAVARFLVKRSRTEPLAILIDDLSRADELSLSLASFLFRQIDSSPILAVASARRGSIGRATATSEVAADLASTACSVDVPALTKAESAEFATHLAGHPISQEEVEDLFERSGGNPLFIRSIATARDVPVEADESIQAILAAQMSALSPRALGLMHTASVIGRAFSPSVLQAAECLGSEALFEHLAEAGQIELVRETENGDFEFTHLLVREVVYTSLDTWDRVRRHARVARAFESAGKDSLWSASATAHHYRQAEPLVGPAKVLEHCRRAGERAVEQLSFDHALPLLRDALEMAGRHLVSDDDRCSLLILLGECELRSGNRSVGVRRLAEAALLARNGRAYQQLGRAALSVCPGLLAIDAGVHDPIAVEVLESALEAIPATEAELRSLLMARLALALQADTRSKRRRAWLVREAAAGARTARSRNRAELARCVSLWEMDELEERRRSAESLVKSADRSADWELMAAAFAVAIAAHHEAGDGHAVAATVERMERAVEVYEVHPARWYPPHYRAMLALEAGRFVDADRHLADFRSRAEGVGGTNSLNSASVMAAVLHFHRGQFGLAVEEVAPMVERFGRLWTWTCALMLALVRARRRTEGAELYAELLERAHTAERDMMWMVSVCLIAEVSADLRDSGGAQRLARLLAPFADRYVTIGYGVAGWGSVARLLGRLHATNGDMDLARDFFRSAELQHMRANAPVWQVYTARDKGEALMLSGRSRYHNEAVESLTWAISAASKAGLPWVAHSARELLRGSHCDTRVKAWRCETPTLWDGHRVR